MKRLGLVVTVLVVALISSLLARIVISDGRDPLVVVHWANSHPMREELLPAMADRFNGEDHETPDGRPIEIKVISCDSSDQAADLIERVGGPTTQAQCTDASEERAPDPTIITPQSDDWLVDVNYGAPQEVVDIDAAQSIAETWLGIVTYKAMAECMGWPHDDIGYAEVIKVLEQGWDLYPDCQTGARWGDPPKLVFTNPNTSTSGRNVLVSLYSRAAGVTPDKLTPALIQSASDDVEDFQTLVDHYMPSTLLVNRKISAGPRYGSFFLMPEDNLANLLLGNEDMLAPDGTRVPAEAPAEPLVMIYPHEGSVLNANPAALVHAPWVTDDQAKAARTWTDYLLEDDQQTAFMNAGFRPPEETGLKVNQQRFEDWGLNPEPPKARIEPGGTKPDVLKQILDSWGTVKKPAIVTFVVDVSGSMKATDASGEQRIEQVKEGLLGLLDAMAGPDSAGQDSQVGLVTFGGSDEDPDDPPIKVLVKPSPLEEVLTHIGAEIDEMQPRGETPLYDAVKKAVEVTSAADGEEGATRAVVVLSDGEDNLGLTCLDDLVTMQSTTSSEADVDYYCRKLYPGTSETTDFPTGPNGDRVSVNDVEGTGSKPPGDVQVFFLGFSDADIEIGRILAQATGGEYVKTDEGLAKVIEALSGYF